MTVEELLEHPLLSLPKNWRLAHAQSYYHCLTTTLLDYGKLLRNLDKFTVAGSSVYMGQVPNTVFIQETARSLSVALIQAIQRYFNQGRPSAAYEMFATHFAPSVNGPNYAMFSPDFYLSSLILRETDVLYRLRSEVDCRPDAAGMFHVPFDRRYLVKSQRFSIPGYPCLYAGSSVHLCYQELREPNWSAHLYGAKLRRVTDHIDQTILLDLRNHVEEFRQQLKEGRSYDGRLMKFLITWPLTMATSMPIDDNNKFHEEYILPQLVLEWVNSGRFDAKRRSRSFGGIAFSSSRVPLGEAQDAGIYNVVVPVHHSNASGLCEVLTKQFEISEPITVNDIEPAALTGVNDGRHISELVQASLQTKPFLPLTPDHLN